MPSTEVERRGGRGRCLIAAEDFGLGDLIMVAQPLSAVLSEDQARTRCASCFGIISGGGGGSRCSRCKRIWYCSRRCQQADWGQHRPECRAWTSQESARTPTRTLRLAGRILNAMNSPDGGKDNGNTSNSASKVREAVEELVHHNDERSPEQKEQFRLMAAFVARLCVAGGGGKNKAEISALLWPSADGRGFPGLVETLVGVLGKVSCNVFSIVAGESGGEEVGCGLYLEAAAANHSCHPNASQSFDGKTLSLRCIRPIPRGEEITIAITHIQRPGPTRREALRKSYFFECRCERCESPGARAEDARLAAYACPDRQCSGICLPPQNGSEDGDGSLHPPIHQTNVANGNGREDDGSSLSLRSLHLPLPEVLVGGDPSDEKGAADILVCRTCGPTSRRAGEARRHSKGVQELLQQGKALEERGEALAARQRLEQAIDRAEAWLHRGNWVLSELYSHLASVCVQLQEFDAATRFASKALNSARVCFSGLTPYFEPWGTSLAFTGKLLLCAQQQPEKAMPILLEAESSIKVTHGQQHPLYREVRSLLDQANGGR
eukprot:g3924.t1